MMKACLVLPNYGPNMMNDPCCYPLGFMYVSSFLKVLGYKVKVLNFNLFDYDLREEFKGQDAVCLTGFEQFLEENKYIQGIAHEVGAKTVLGGAMATFREKDMRKVFDAVVPGEIEDNLPINVIPHPDYKGFGIEEYNRRHSVKYIGILASRGCPFCCVFCSHLCNYRERTLSKVEAELDAYIHDYDIKYVVFNDNTLNVTKERFLAICEMMRNKHVSWSAAIRCDVFDDDMAYAASNSGCQYFVVGVESFRQERLDKMNKRVKVDQVKTTLDLLHKYKIDYHGNIILGLDDETVEDITEEIEELPKGYNLYPVLAQSFVGTKVNSSLPVDQRDHLNSIFSKYAESKGKYVYAGIQ